MDVNLQKHDILLLLTRCVHSARSQWCRLVQSLRKLSGLLEAEGMAGRAGLVWLLDCSANISNAQLDGFAAYGTAIGPEKASLGSFGLPSQALQQCHSTVSWSLKC